jgi:hypothetical protein
MVGFRQPLRDPWVHNVVTILKNFNFSNITAEFDLPWDLDGGLRGRARGSTDWDSPVFRDHTELQLMEFLGADFLNWDGVSALPVLDALSIKNLVIDKLLISYGGSRLAAYSRNFGSDHLTHLRARCLRYGITEINTTINHFANLPRKVPAFLVTHYIKLLSGALNYDGGRRRKFEPNGSVHSGRGPGNPFPCYLCGHGNVEFPGDNERHIFLSCLCVKGAWADVLLHPKGPADGAWYSSFSSKNSPLFILDYPPAEGTSGYNRLSLVMSFCWAVYKTIGQIRMGRSATDATGRAVALTLTLRNIWAPIKTKNSGKRKR